MKFKKVLLVEDDEIDIYIARKVITREQFADEIVLKMSIPEALKYINGLTDDPGRLPDVVFLDLNLPGADGFDFLKAMRASKIDLNIVVLTAVLRTYKDNIQIPKEFPMVKAILEKPLTAEKLSKIEIVASEN